MRPTDIAIIGIGCRYPGGADTPEKFWEMILGGVDAVGKVPPERWDIEAYHDPRPGMPGRTVARKGGFIEGIDQFDAEFFGISPREAELMDPQQRLLLEASWEALEDGGVLADREAAATGVFVGISTNDYSLLQSGIDELRTIDVYTTTGSVMSIAANRVSHALNLGGPSLAVDTACSSSLIAMHLACRSLRDGDCRVALVGGVNALLLPTPFVAFSRMSMLAADGRCKAFDARADGFVRSEGVGVVALQPLADALGQGRPIYAVIRGTAANQDGHTNGLTVPSPTAQEAVIRAACRDAGVEESAISYVEAHGTGTPVGDPIEATALSRAIGQARPSDSPLLIGSVKTNIGHLEAGAGVAGVIKTALALGHGRVPPSLHFETPTPYVAFDELNLKVVTKAEPLMTAPAIAGVNSFGFGGSNAHAILESPPAPALAEAARDVGAVLLPLPARTRDRQAVVAEVWRSFLAPGGAGADIDVADICHAAATRRNHRGERMAVAAGNRDELIARLGTIANGEPAPGTSVGRPEEEPPRPVFVYSGQGTQWWAMGRELMTSEPVFREVIERCDALFSELGDWSLIEELGRDEESSRVHVTAIAQPAIFAIQVALTTLWRSWGVEPAATVGHSVGEVAAAWAGGILSLEAAAHVIFHRGRTMEQASERGRMLAAAITAEEARSLIAPYGERVSLGAINSPQLMTLSGDGEPLEAIAAELEARGIFNRFLAVQYAFHSAHMDGVRDDLMAALGVVPLDESRIPVVSTVTGAEATGDDFGTDYWWRNVRDSVLFGPSIDRLVEMGFRTFLEVGPHPALSGPVAECLREAGQRGTVLGSLKRGESERTSLLASLGALFVAGHEVNWDAVLGGPRQAVRLPREAWHHQRFWHESERSRAIRSAPRPHPLLAHSLLTSEPTWEADLDVQLFPWLLDHRVQNHAVFPAAGYLEMMAAAGRSVLAAESTLIEDVDFRKALVVAEEEPPTKIQIRCRTAEGLVEVLGRDRSGEWSVSAAGSLRRPDDTAEPPPTDLARLRSRLTTERDGGAISERFAEDGLRYGPAFCGIETAFRRNGEALGLVRMPESIAKASGHYYAHPGMLDSCLQVTIAAVPDDAALSAGPFLPVHIDRVHVRGPIGMTAWSHVRVRQAAGRSLVLDLSILDEAGRPLIEVEGFRCQALARQRTAISASADEWLHGEVWRARPRVGAASAARELAPMESIVAAAKAVAARHAAPDGRMGRHRGRGTAADDLAMAFVVAAFRELGWPMRKGHRTSLAALRVKLGVVPAHHKLFDRLIAFLAKDGFVAHEGDTVTVLRRPPKRDPAAMWRGVLVLGPGLLPDATLLRRCGSQLAGILRGSVDPLQVLFPGGSPATLEHFYQSGWSLFTYNAMIAEAVAEAVRQVPAGRQIRVLEIGAGTGGLTSHVLPRLPADRTRYIYTDLSNVFFARAEQAFFDYRFVEFATLDIERSPEEQSFEPGSFDIVLASDVLHATRDLRRTLANIRAFLAPGGVFAGIEIPPNSRWPDIVFGVTEGWWRFGDGVRTDHPAISDDAWARLLNVCDFDAAHALTVPNLDDGESQIVLLAQRPAERTEETRPPRLTAVDPAAGPAPMFERPWLVLADRSGFAAKLEDVLSARGDRAVTIRPGEAYRRLDDTAFEVRPQSLDDFKRVLGELKEANLTPAMAVHLWSLDIPTAEATSPETLAQAEAIGPVGLLNLAQASSAAGVRFAVVTRGSQAVGDGPITVGAAPTWGLGRAIVNEEASLDCRLIDLDPAAPVDEAAEFMAEMEVADGEREVAFRAGGRYVNRVVRTSLDQLTRPAGPGDSSVGYRLEIPSPGVLDRLALVERPRRTPGPAEVEIAVRAASLNFRDVMKALGIYPSESVTDDLPGDECAGVIVAAGSDVGDLAIGDEVVGIGSGCLASYVTLPAALVFHKPARLDFEEAVTIPVPFLTAWYALHEVGRLRRGETVLLHAATGGVGLAALQVAQAAGATVLATAGSDEKRELLRALGVEHVMDSRSLAFGDQVRTITGGRGVDIVLNSLSGRAIEMGLASLAPGGRFLEIGKTDIYQNTRVGLRPFRNNVSLQAIDLRQIMETRPDLVASAMRQIIRRVEAKRFNALPHRIFPIDRVVDAFRHLAQARHLGKVIVNTEDAHVNPVPVANRQQPDLRPEATYVVTGGLSGFGLAAANWMADRGARHLVLVGRRGAATEEARAAVAALTARGISVVAEAADVTRREDVERTFDRIAREMPPVRGILHAAMVIDDALISQLDPDRIARVMAPKVVGAWHLHERSLELDLDFFVMFSSMAALLGSPGQGNYVAANSFLIALAAHRHRLGKPALAVDWGRIGDTGYVARNAEVGHRLDRMGLLGMPVARATEMLGHLIVSDANHVGLVRVDWQAWTGTGDGSVPNRLSELSEGAAGASDRGRQGLGEILLSAPEGERLDLLVSMLRDQVANVLRASASDLDVERPLTDLGLDSLMAIDLINRIETEFEVALPRERVAVGATISTLAATLLELVTGEAAPQRQAQPHAEPGVAVPTQCLVPLRSGGSRPPLFLLHSSGGAVTNYARLVAALPASLPIVGVQSRALVTDQEEFETAGAMAEAYAELIGRHQPEGSLHMAGFSMGGYLALGAAEALERSGRDVALVGLIDSDPQWADSSLSGVFRIRGPFRDLAVGLGREVGFFKGVDEAELERDIDALLDELADKSEAERLEGMLAWLAANGGENGPFADEIRQAVYLTMRHSVIIDNYRPGVIRAPIVSWRARGAIDGGASWSKLTIGGCQEESFDCSHYDILLPPVVKAVAASLDAALLDTGVVADEAAE